MPEHTKFQIIRRPELLKQYGFSNTTLHNRIKAGLMPSPLSLGGLRAVGWLEHELNAVLAAMIAGKSEDHIRALVSHLVDQRKNAA